MLFNPHGYKMSSCQGQTLRFPQPKQFYCNCMFSMKVSRAIFEVSN